LPNRFLSCCMLTKDGDSFLFDCGEATQISLKKNNLKWKKIKVIFISHTHADHVTGLPGILMLLTQVERTEPLYIIGPPNIKAYIEASYATLEMYKNYEIVIKEINPAISQEVFSTDKYKVISVPVNHTRICTGYSFIEKDKPGVFYPHKAELLGVEKGKLWSKLQNGENVTLADGSVIEPNMVMGEKRKGMKFSYITDTLFVENIKNIIRDSDLIVCEGMFLKELTALARDKKHMTAQQAGILARISNVKKLIITHFSPRYVNHELNKLLKEAKEEFENTFLAKSGDEYILNYQEEKVIDKCN